MIGAAATDSKPPYGAKKTSCKCAYLTLMFMSKESEIFVRSHMPKTCRAGEIKTVPKIAPGEPKEIEHI